MELYKTIVTEKEILCKYSENNIEIQDDLKSLEEKIMLFEEVKILLGAEITVNPGVHIIVIVDDDDISLLSNLLKKIGYLNEKKGEDKGITPKMDISQLFSEQFIADKIVIAPHVDSNNGIFNELKGYYRAEVFKSDTLKAMTCNSPQQLKKIQDMIRDTPQYQRNSPIAFINASDSHHLETIGSKSSYIKLKEINYKNIYEAFKVPEQTISNVKNPKVISVIENIIDSGKAILIDSVDKDLEKTIAKALCATLNKSYGHVVIGVNKTTSECSLTGISLEEEELKSIIKSAAGLLNSRSEYLNMKVLSEKLGNGRSVSVITCKSMRPEIWYLKEENEAYIYLDGFKKASILEIESIVRNNIIEDLKKFQDTNNIYIENALCSIHSLKNPIYKYEILENIDTKCIPLCVTVNIEPIEANHDPSWDKLLKEAPVNGSPHGNVYYALPTEVRLEDAYLRCTCPSFVQDIINIPSKVKRNKGVGIVMTGKGGVHIVEGSEWYFNALKGQALLLTIAPDFANRFSAYSVLGWLKSSICIWYAQCKNDSTNFYLPNILTSIPIPEIECMKPGGKVDRQVKEIIDKENIFLSKFNSENFCNQCENEQSCDNNEDCGLSDFVNEYNNSVLDTAKKIDEIIFSAFKLENEQIEIISEDLNNAKVFNYIEL